MNKYFYQIVLTNFFTEEKTYGTFKATNHIEADKKAREISSQNPECVIAVYYNGELIIGLRPNGMETELKKIEGGEFEEIIGFMKRWKVNPFTGTQDELPDYSLPEDGSDFSEKNFSPSEAPKARRGRPQKPHRVSEREFYQKSAC
jgi:hypothetical protein